MPEEKLGATEGEMRLLPDKQSPNFQSMLNTYILCFGVATGLISVGVLYNTQVSADRDTQRWIMQHEQLHKDRQVQVESDRAALSQRVSTLEAGRVQIENLAYRITVSEQSILSSAKAAQEMQASLNTLSTDVRVMSTILTRLAEQYEIPPRSPVRR